jgi:ribosomal protein S18 acetylase RimI-like enzyme
VTDHLLADLERYYDDVPRAFARTEEIGPFTLFVTRDPHGWPYYARPRLGYAGGATVEDVEAVRARQRELGVPEAFEWVVENAPDLGRVIAAAGLEPGDYPLMVLGEREQSAPLPPGVRLELLAAEHADLAAVRGAVGAAFGETDLVEAASASGDLQQRVSSGLLRMVGAFDEVGPVGGGSHSPRDGVSELMGIGVVPRARERGVGAAVTAALVEDARSLGVRTVFLSAGSDRVAAIYGRVGFDRVGTAGIAEAPGG